MVTLTSPITVVVPSSPIESHPDTDMICAVIDSIHHHLPDSRIIITFDGLRAQQHEWRDRYNEHILRCTVLMDRDPAWRHVEIIEYATHKHQVGMMRDMLPDITTPLLMYVEHDMMLRVGRIIDFGVISDFILSGRSDCVRLYLRPEIPEVHQEFLHGLEPDAPFLRISQWSQNAHVATVELYRTLLSTYFGPNANCYIEDGVWGHIKDEYPRFKLHLYSPVPDQPKYLLHLDGRRQHPKYEEEQVYG
jgi:hypothetical protein